MITITTSTDVPIILSATEDGNVTHLWDQMKQAEREWLRVLNEAEEAHATIPKPLRGDGVSVRENRMFGGFWPFCATSRDEIHSIRDRYAAGHPDCAVQIREFFKEKEREFDAKVAERDAAWSASGYRELRDRVDPAYDRFHALEDAVAKSACKSRADAQIKVMFIWSHADYEGLTPEQEDALRTLENWLEDTPTD